MGKGGRGKGGNRWGGGGGGATPWAFAHVCDDNDTLGLWALTQKVPDAWIDWNHGGKRKPNRMHTTVILKMSEPVHLQRLQSICQAAQPVHVSVGDLFCEAVNRITDAEVYCIGVSLQSAGLRSLKTSWCSEEPEERRKDHVPYDTDGHISLAYILGQHREDAQRFVAEHRASICDGRSFILNEIAYQDEYRTESAIRLEGQERSRAAVPAAQRPESLSIDGSILEGGGQILRMSSSYAALLGLPLQIVKIRAGRSKPGLAAQHLESLRLVRDVSNGRLTNDRVGSLEVSLAPAKLAPGSFSADPGTAGAITLMIQAAICPMIFAGGKCSAHLRGGTDVAFSPPLEYCRRMLAPALKRMGAEFTLSCSRRGFYPKGGGDVHLDVPGLQPGQTLLPIDISTRGDVQLADATLFVTQELRDDEAAAIAQVRRALHGLAPEIRVEPCVVQASDPRSPKLWVEVLVSTTTGAAFHGSGEPKDLNGGNKGGKGQKGWGKGGGASPAEVAASSAREAREPLDKQLQTGAAVDEHLIDQLILPASLAAGKSKFLAAELSLHAKTAIHIAGLCVPGASFKETQVGTLFLIEVDGIGHTPGGDDAGVAAQPAKQPRTAAPMEEVEDVVEVKKGGFSRGPANMLKDFQADMAQLSTESGATVSIDVPGDRILVRGGAKERSNAQAKLMQVLQFYRSGGVAL